MSLKQILTDTYALEDNTDFVMSRRGDSATVLVSGLNLEVHIHEDGEVVCNTTVLGKAVCLPFEEAIELANMATVYL